MPNHELHQSLSELKEHIGHVKSPETRGHLEELVGELEVHLDDTPETREQSILGSLTGLIDQLEVEHPKLTSVLNQMMVSLSNMGI